MVKREMTLLKSLFFGNPFYDRYVATSTTLALQSFNELLHGHEKFTDKFCLRQTLLNPLLT